MPSTLLACLGVGSAGPFYLLCWRENVFQNVKKCLKFPSGTDVLKAHYFPSQQPNGAKLNDKPTGDRVLSCPTRKPSFIKKQNSQPIHTDWPTSISMGLSDKAPAKRRWQSGLSIQLPPP